eukprot:gene6727-biopygen4550
MPLRCICGLRLHRLSRPIHGLVSIIPSTWRSWRGGGGAGWAAWTGWSASCAWDGWYTSNTHKWDRAHVPGAEASVTAVGCATACTFVRVSVRDALADLRARITDGAMPSTVIEEAAAVKPAAPAPARDPDELRVAGLREEQRRREAAAEAVRDAERAEQQSRKMSPFQFWTSGSA